MATDFQKPSVTEKAACGTMSEGQMKVLMIV